MNPYAPFHDLRIQIWNHVYREIIYEIWGTKVPDVSLPLLVIITIISIFENQSFDISLFDN